MHPVKLKSDACRQSFCVVLPGSHQRFVRSQMGERHRVREGMETGVEKEHVTQTGWSNDV